MNSDRFTSYPLKFRPLAKERLWGGKRLSSLFQLTSDKNIGEVWTLSDHTNGMSVCVNGPLAGHTLRDIILRYGTLYLGQTERDCFPLLIKFIDAEEDLSVQIHPDDDYAQTHEGDFGKTEAWYILETKPDAQIHYGHSFPNRGTYERAIHTGKVRDYLQFIDVSADDFIFVPSGTLHAIMSGVMLIEIQQTSDVTYRVYDWDRVDADGKSRELHTKKAGDVLRFEKQPIPDERRVVEERTGMKHEHFVRCPYFTVDKWSLRETQQIERGKKGQPDVLICAKGEGVLQYREEETLPIRPGDTLLIPSDLDTYGVQPNDEMVLLRTYY